MSTEVLNTSNSAREQYCQARIDHWNYIARYMDHWTGWGREYHRRLEQVYRYLVAPKQRVLEVGCAHGDLLAALKPSVGFGVDFSPEMIHRASQRHPEYHFLCMDAHDIDLKQEFDVIILSDLLNDLWDVQLVFRQLIKLTSPHTRLIINTYSRLWEQPLALASRLNLAKPSLYQNWLTLDDIRNILYLTGFEVVRTWQEILWPLPTPLLGDFLNRFVVKIWPFHPLALTNFVLARLVPYKIAEREKPVVSVVVPARNEAGNINAIFERTPELGSKTELVFVEGHSKDNTYAVIKQAMEAHPEKPCQLLRQNGIGKGDAVRMGFDHANGDVLMILDADLTVPPEYLPAFYDALCSGKGDFINGVRLVYPMEDQAMRFFNLLGNKFFSVAFSWLLGQPVKDTLCGTKVLWKDAYKKIVANREYFGDFDPFGDYDLLFGAARLGLKIVDLPIRYQARTYGDTNIQRWKHGWLLLRMVLFAAKRLKFI